MSGDDLWFDEPGDEWEDDEVSDEHDFDDDFSETLPCPECGAEVYEDVEQCPVCGSYITRTTRVFSGRPGWWIVLGLLGILAAILALSGLVAW